MTDSIYHLRHRDILSICVIALLGLGTLMVYSATMRPGDALGWRGSPDGLKQAVFAFLAAVTFFLVGRIDYRRFMGENTPLIFHPVMWLMALAATCCVLVLVPHVGMEVNGARRWIKLGPVQLQPSELAKWAVVLFLAFWLSRRPVNLDRFFTGLVPTLIPVVILCLLVVIQDFGTAALIAVCALTMLLAGRARIWHLLIIVPPALVIGFWFVHHTPYRWRRMTAFLDPYAAPDGSGYHMIQSLLSFSTGGVLGTGLGNGVQKLGYLPENTTDFIFSVICEELGLFGALLTIALYMGILYVAWQVVKQKCNDFGRLLVFGVASMLSLQAIINMAVATVSVPTKGLSLPLVSAGGTGLLITAAALGLMSSVVNENDQPERPLNGPAPDPGDPGESFEAGAMSIVPVSPLRDAA